MEIPEYQVLLKDIIMDTPYSGISFKDGRTYKGEGDLRGGGGEPGGLPRHDGAVLQGDIPLTWKQRLPEYLIGRLNSHRKPTPRQATHNCSRGSEGIAPSPNQLSCHTKLRCKASQGLPEKANADIA